MSCCGVKLEARRNGDLRVTYTPASRKFTFSGLNPVFTVRRSDTSLLTVTTSATPNGSVFQIVGDSMVLTVEKADLLVLDSGPDTEKELLSYDVVVADQTGFENWLLGGPFVLLGLNDASCGDCGGDVEVSLGGQCVEISIEGGNMGAGASVSLAELNAAVQEAEAAADSAAASATVAGSAGAMAGAAAGATSGATAGATAGAAAGATSGALAGATAAEAVADTIVNDMLPLKANTNLDNVSNAVLTRRAPKSAPINNLVAFLGDSITADGVNNTTNATRNMNRGMLSWLPLLTNRRFISSQSLNFGVSGDTSTQVAARVGSVVASGAGTCVVLAGTNDIGTNNFTTTTTALATIYQALANANILIIALPILPRTLVTEANYAFVNRVNRWMIEQSKVYPNFRFIDPFLFGEPYSLEMAPRAGYSWDGLHPTAIGMRYITKPIADYLNTLMPVPPRTIRTVTDYYVAGQNPGGYINLNPMMAGAGGSISSGGATITGTSPDSWTLFADAGGGVISGLTVAGSSSTSETGLACQRIVVGGTATGGFQTVCGLNQYAFTSGLVSGDTVQFVVEYELQGGVVGVSGIAPYFQAEGNPMEFSWDAFPSVSDDLTVDGYFGTVATPPITLTATPSVTSCGLWVYFKNVGTTRSMDIKIVSAAVRRVV